MDLSGLYINEQTKTDVLVELIKNYTSAYKKESENNHFLIDSLYKESKNPTLDLLMVAKALDYFHSEFMYESDYEKIIRDLKNEIVESNRRVKKIGENIVIITDCLKEKFERISEHYEN